jgi:FixJ family two-component response regulator
MQPIPTVFIVDDDFAARSSLRMLLKSLGFVTLAYDCAAAFLEAYDASQPGCLLLDVRMPGMSGLELQQRLSLEGKSIPVIFITGHGDVPMAVEAMQRGAMDFLQKPFEDHELLVRVQRALARDKDNRARLKGLDDAQERLISLTPREREVLDLVVGGTPNKVMAFRLGISQRTVEIHRARVMEKMCAGSLAQLVRTMADLGPYAASQADGLPAQPAAERHLFDHAPDSNARRAMQEEAAQNQQLGSSCGDDCARKLLAAT